MATYSVRCRHTVCRHRRVFRKHPDAYKVIPKCPSCGKQKGWRIENRAYNQRNLCYCSGPVSDVGVNYPHRTTHPYCEQHPEGIYNQAKRQGVTDEDIPAEYWPERLKNAN